jgi:hypothetical protein
MAYRIAWQVLDDDLGQGTTATFTLKWESQST